MSGVVLVLFGLLLCFAGARSVRLAVFATGFAAGWLVADALGASVTTELLVGLASAVIVFVVTIFVSAIMLFVVGAVVGAAVGAKFFQLLEGNQRSPVLALVFAGVVAVAFGFLADRYRRRFLIWATAVGGAALVLSGLGVIAPSALHGLRAPTNTVASWC